MLNINIHPWQERPGGRPVGETRNIDSFQGVAGGSQSGLQTNLEYKLNNTVQYSFTYSIFLTMIFNSLLPNKRHFSVDQVGSKT